MNNNLKEKNIAGILALFLGPFGIHRFYLGQKGLGVLYAVFCWFPLIWFVCFVDAMRLLTMDTDKFNAKYNADYYDVRRRDSDTDFDRYRRERNRDVDRWERRQNRRDRYFDREEVQREQPRSKVQSRPTRTRRSAQRTPNPYKNSGVQKYRDFDYDGAIEDFEKALQIDNKDIATHFNLACAYSLNENAPKAFYHLDQAVAHGFSDMKRIKEHDALAYIRIKDEFCDFEDNGFRLVASSKSETPVANGQMKKENILETKPDLLDQLKKLGELREKGILSEKEFIEQKTKLLQ